MTLVFELVVTVAGSAAVFLLAGVQIYGLGAILAALLFFSLMVTSDARTATREDAPIRLQPMPWAMWLGLTAIISVAMSMFWPMIPVIIASQKLRNARARRAYEASERSDAARASESGERP